MCFLCVCFIVRIGAFYFPFFSAQGKRTLELVSTNGKRRGKQNRARGKYRNRTVVNILHTWREKMRFNNNIMPFLFSMT